MILWCCALETIAPIVVFGSVGIPGTYHVQGDSGRFSAAATFHRKTRPIDRFAKRPKYRPPGRGYLSP